MKQDKPHRGDHKHIWDDYEEPRQPWTLQWSTLQSDEKVQKCYLCKEKRVVKK